MKQIQHHVIDAASAALVVTAADEPGQGGAHHSYLIGKGDSLLPEGAMILCQIEFQNGPIKEHGINGVTLEALLAIGIDRLKDFQEGPYRCRENALALTKIEEALHWLHHRTLERTRRNVEGTSQK